jgi:hypothetical protein
MTLNYISTVLTAIHQFLSDNEEEFAFHMYRKCVLNDIQIRLRETCVEMALLNVKFNRLLMENRRATSASSVRTEI